MTAAEDPVGVTPMERVAYAVGLADRIHEETGHPEARRLALLLADLAQIMLGTFTPPPTLARHGAEVADALRQLRERVAGAPDVPDPFGTLRDLALAADNLARARRNLGPTP